MKQMAAELKRMGKGVIVFDPGLDIWAADHQTADFDNFLTCAKQSKSCYLFIDEASNVCGQKDKDKSVWLASQSRHRGHSSFFICQRSAMLAPSIRENCSKLFLFRTSLKEAVNLQEEWDNGV